MSFQWKLNNKKVSIEVKILKPSLIKIISSKKGWPKRGLFRCNHKNCGKEFETTLYKVKIGHTKSCGCYQIESTKVKHTSHGHTKNKKVSSTYITWQNMFARCYNPGYSHYKHYGGRGITVCDRWLESFENFLEDMGEKPNGFWIERINNDKGYFKGNCIWATPKEQQNNRRNNKYVEYKGDLISIKDLYALTKSAVAYDTLAYRLKVGWPIEEALKSPKDSVFRNKKVDTYRETTIKFLILEGVPDYKIMKAVNCGNKLVKEVKNSLKNKE